MKYFAQVIGGIVQQVQVALEAPGQEWIECGNGLRKQYPGPGYSHDADADVFVTPRPFPSWTIDGNHDWQPPTPKPGGGLYFWDEQTLTWKADQ